MNPSPYEPPTGAELRRLLAAWGVTSGEAAQTLAIPRPSRKESQGRTVRRWTGGERPCGFPVLFTLALRLGGVQITPEGWRTELAAQLRETDR